MMNDDFFVQNDLPYSREAVEEALHDWESFNRALPSLSLKELYVMYNQELMLLRRGTFLARLRSRIRVAVANAAEEYLLELEQTRKPKGVTHE